MEHFEYLNERTLRNVRTLLKLAEYDMERLQGENEPILCSSLDELEVAYRLCESARDALDEVLTLIGKMADEREDEDEGC